jgi:UDP-glucuronate decarboxylase
MGRCLVTGAAGFLGFHLCQQLLSEGHVVVGLDNFMSGSHINRDDLLKNKAFSFFERDVLDCARGTAGFQELVEAGPRFDEIYHLACPASPPVYQRDPLNTLAVCYEGTRNFLDLAQATGARILIASTSEIYGDPIEHPQSEAYRGNVNTMGPRACYDEGKRVSETLGYLYASKGVVVRTVRIFNTYGPRMSPGDGRVVTNFVMQAIRGEALTIYGDGSQTRSFCFFSDTIDGLIAVARSDCADPINIGSQEEFTVGELADMVIDVCGRPLSKVYAAIPEDDPVRRRPDTSRALEKLGWQPRVGIREGLQKMYHYMAATSGTYEKRGVTP